MRIVPFIISAVVTSALVFALNKKWGSVPPIGKFLSPQQGFWQNAESKDAGFNDDLKFSNLKGKANVYFDERLVPHVFADNDEDLFFVQGYLHAKFRLFQMDLQTMYAAGRLAEIIGNDPRIINVDRETRRSGMVFAAENALKEMEADPVSKACCDAYTAGVNAYIESLTDATLPIEYKLLDFKPEKWSNLKIALFLKQMSRTLAGNVDDIELTNEKKFIPFSEFNTLYPQVPDSLIPIVPKGTKFDAASIVPVKPASADSLYFGKKDSVAAMAEIIKPSKDNGSNNWVVAGIKTKSGAPILCNDPHLELNFPSIWYEMQLNSPHVNVYGATFPGAPNVIIGFNDNIAWGVTNAQRDVKDFYEIKFKDDSKKQYWFNGQWADAKIHIDTIKIRGAGDMYDTVAYTVFGPVMFDKSFPDTLSHKAIACRWSAHDPSNEGMTFYKLNRAKNYDDYLDAIKTFNCPGQNFIFASKSGDIAIWQQAKFPARWNGQGLMVMPGEDSSYMWQGYIPQSENPHVINPEQGFLVSANQRPADSSYPYFIPGNYITARAISINHHLQNMQQVTIDDMKALQNDYFNVTAEDVRPVLLKYTRENDLGPEAKKYLDICRNWNLMADANSIGQTIYYTWWDSLQVEIWSDELSRSQPVVVWPGQQTLLEALLRDSAFKYVDNINTPQKESLYDDVTNALKKATVQLTKDEKDGKLEWAKHKSPRIYHLLRNSVMPFSRAIPVGGDGNIINATTDTHGPSWRMIVQLSETTEAYGVFPGGESGNPGSRFYDDFVDSWAKGQYYNLWMMKRTETGDKKIKWTMNFSR